MADLQALLDNKKEYTNVSLAKSHQSSLKNSIKSVSILSNKKKEGKDCVIL